MAELDLRTYEVTFCSRVAGWANELFHQHPEWPFRRAEIEASAPHRKCSGLCFYGEDAKMILAGEVKMPGAKGACTPYNHTLMEHSAEKAEKAGAEFFFTWNVNDFVLFDQRRRKLPVMKRRLREYPLGLALDKPQDVDRLEVEIRVKKFLADLFGELAAILASRQEKIKM